ncbi:MAG: methyltransferase domain-containing protein [Acidobacteria bacterium]|nr:methyltransferase domain-containing protein [Acidobacteriota bacterium]
MYWLKPFDAVHDAANAWALGQFPWDEPVLEIGGGDGMFSFIAHDGEFRAADDRYAQSDPGARGDIFDIYHPGRGLTIRRYHPGRGLTIRRPASRTYQAGVDLKRSHLLKSKETNLYRSLVVAAPEPLPFAPQTFRTVFLYFPHGLMENGKTLNYERALREIRRVIRPGGALLMTAMNRTIAGCFVCHPLHQFFARRGWRRLSGYFRTLDAGRYEEIRSFSRSPEEWKELLEGSGFRLDQAWTHVTPAAWRVYDLQTRPWLKALIRSSRVLERWRLKSVVKAVWVYAWLPGLALFFLLFARPTRFSPGSGQNAKLLLAFQATAI